MFDEVLKDLLVMPHKGLSYLLGLSVLDYIGLTFDLNKLEVTSETDKPDCCIFVN